MLTRLRIGQKLNLLVVLPLIAVVITTVPIVLERADAAGASAATARAAKDARDVGALIQDLQQERLLALGYLATDQLEHGAVLAQVQASTDDTARLRAAAATHAELAGASGAMTALDDVRPRILDRTADVADVYAVYRDAVGALIDALQLGDRPGVDAAGLSRLAALDALMRANEEASSVGAAVVALATDPSVAPQLSAALAALDQQGKRFRQLADRSQVQLVDLVEHGQAGVRLRRLAGDLDTSNAPSGPARAAAALTVAGSYTDLRLIAQDRVVRDIATAAQGRAQVAQTAALGVAGGGLLLFMLVVGLSVVVSRSISQPLRRLSRAAGQVATLAGAELTRVVDSDETGPAPPRLAAVEIDSADEIGELATAFNQVQATAALMLERQSSSRRNVSVMFANIARRTQTLVGRQLLLIDELEQSEPNPDLLERLYRLDHIATRLRRSADALLVVSGTRDDAGEEMPVPLADIVRSAVAEIEGYRSVRLRAIPPVLVDVELVGDLRLLLAELLENATSFSPPGSLADIVVEVGTDCVISIVDHGIGMTAAQLAEENRRLVDRERLDVAPTSVLGLFVVGRLARRHGLAVRLSSTPGQGVTATVTVPRRLLVTGPAQVAPRPHGRPFGALAAALSGSGDQFAWFAAPDSPEPMQEPRRELPAGPSAPAPAAPIAPIAPIPPVAPPTAPRPVALPEPTTWEPEPGPPPISRGGLTRRTPGKNLPQSTLPGVPAAAPRPDRRPALRDPAAERAELDDFLDGFARADSSDPHDRPASNDRPDPNDTGDSG